MPDTEPTTVAYSFLSVRSYIESTYGAGSFRLVRSAIAERFPQFPPVISPGAWYPTAALTAILDAAHDHFGPEDFYERCGRAIVKDEVNVFMRFALRLTSPLWILEKANDTWRSAQTHGRWEISGKRGEANALLLDYPGTAGYCRLLTAYFEVLLGLTGASGLTVVHPKCRHRGEGACLFVARWRTSP
jgi:hypothetical protein